jgi:hypothetical protein
VRHRTTLCAVTLLLLAGGCSRSDPEGLRSQIKHAAELSRECELLLKLDAQGKLSTHYRLSHGYYLTKQVKELQKQASNAKAEGKEQQIAEFEAQLAELKLALEQIETHKTGDRFTSLTGKFEAMENQI